MPNHNNITFDSYLNEARITATLADSNPDAAADLRTAIELLEG